MQGGKQYSVDVLIADSKTDLAVLRIKDPGGKTFEGTGDASFKVSEGEKPAGLGGFRGGAP